MLKLGDPVLFGNRFGVVQFVDYNRKVGLVAFERGVYRDFPLLSIKYAANQIWRIKSC